MLISPSAKANKQKAVRAWRKRNPITFLAYRKITYHRKKLREFAHNSLELKNYIDKEKAKK